MALAPNSDGQHTPTIGLASIRPNDVPLPDSTLLRNCHHHRVGGAALEISPCLSKQLPRSATRVCECVSTLSFHHDLFSP